MYNHGTHYFRDDADVNGGHHRVYNQRDNSHQLAAVRIGMSQAGYSNASSGQSHSMHQAPAQQPTGVGPGPGPGPGPSVAGQQSQSMPPPPHVGGMSSYHQQSQPAGPPYVIGPGQYNAGQFYRPQQPPQGSYQQSPNQQHPQQGSRPNFVGISASANPNVRLQAPPQHPSYLVQQQNPNSPIRMAQQQPAQQFIGQQQPQRMQMHQQVTTGPGGQPQLIRVQQQQPQMHQQMSPSTQRIVGPGGQVQVISTSSGGMMMTNQYGGQGPYQTRPLIISQQPIVVQQQQQQMNSQHPQQSEMIQYQYKQQPNQQSMQAKQQMAASPSSSSTSSTPAPQFATPNQKLDVPSGPNYSLSPSTANLSTGSADGLRAYAAVQSDSSQVLTKQRLDDLVREVDPYEQLDEDVKDTLLQMADEFIESVVSGACQIAKHRKSNAMDVKDVQLCLERNWNMWIPGFGSDDIRPYKKACVTEAHKQRTALIKKTLKKI